jgi:hypothetical protein
LLLSLEWRGGRRLASSWATRIASFVLTFSRDGNLIATGSRDRTAKVWGAATFSCIMTLSEHEASVRSLSFTKDSSFLVTTSDDWTGAVWRLSDGALVSRLKGHTGQVSFGAFDSLGSHIVTTSNDETVRYWDSSSGALLWSFQTQGPIASAGFSEDGNGSVSPVLEDVSTFCQLTRFWLRRGGYHEVLPQMSVRFYGIKDDSKVEARSTRRSEHSRIDSLYGPEWLALFSRVHQATNSSFFFRLARPRPWSPWSFHLLGTGSVLPKPLFHRKLFKFRQHLEPYVLPLGALPHPFVRKLDSVRAGLVHGRTTNPSA